MIITATTIPAIAPTGNPLWWFGVATIAGPPAEVAEGVDEVVSVTLDSNIGTICAGGGETTA